MSKHTPGPWRAGTAYDTKYTRTICANTSDRVAVVNGGGVSEETLEADARLIAAAPELLDACVAAFHYIFRDGKQVADNDWSKERTLAFIKAAIAKAEGKQ